jgi:hypothetical protein
MEWIQNHTAVSTVWIWIPNLAYQRTFFNVVVFRNIKTSQWIHAWHILLKQVTVIGCDEIWSVTAVKRFCILSRWGCPHKSLYSNGKLTGYAFPRAEVTTEWGCVLNISYYGSLRTIYITHLIHLNVRDDASQLHMYFYIPLCSS